MKIIVSQMGLTGRWEWRIAVAGKNIFWSPNVHDTSHEALREAQETLYNIEIEIRTED